MQQAEAELKKSAPKLFKEDAPDSGRWEFDPLKSLSDAKDALSNISPGQIGEKIGNTIMGQYGSVKAQILVKWGLFPRMEIECSAS